MSRFLPYPLLSLALLVMWLLLNGFSAGQFLLGLLVAIFAAIAMRTLKPSKPRIIRWRPIPVLFAHVFIDAISANIAAARLILIARERPQPAFLRIRLALRDPTGLAALAMILTSMPGSAWIEYNARRGELLLHVLDMQDRRYWRDLIKKRYERPLRVIFGEIDE